MRAPLIFLIFFAASPLFAAGEIQIQNVSVEAQSASRYVLNGTVENTTPETREVILRGQVAFYEKASPEGDLPVAILRKDVSMVLKSKESRLLHIILLNEGTAPKGSLRLQPILRIRRQRPWNY